MNNQAFMEGMGLIGKAIKKEVAKQTFDTDCHCDEPVVLVVSDDNDTYTSCRVCGGEIEIPKEQPDDDNEAEDFTNAPDLVEDRQQEYEDRREEAQVMNEGGRL